MAATVSNLGRGNYVLGGLGAVRGPSAADAMVENQQEARAAREAELLAQQRRQQMQLAQSEEARAQTTFAQQQEVYRRQQAAAAEARNREALVRQAQEEFLRRRPVGLTLPDAPTTAAPPPASMRVLPPPASDALPSVYTTPATPTTPVAPTTPATPTTPAAPVSGVPGVEPLSMGLSPIGPAGTPGVQVASLDPMASFRVAVEARPNLFGDMRVADLSGGAGTQVADLSGGAGADTLSPAETPGIRAVNPQASALVQDVQGILRQGDIARAVLRIKEGLARGVYGPMSSPIGRAIGYAFDSPEEAEQRTTLRETAQWFKDPTNLRFLEANPEYLPEVAADPIGFVRWYRDADVSALAPESESESEPEPEPEVAGMFEAPEQLVTPEATSGLTLTPPAAQEVSNVAAQTDGDISRFYLRNPASVLQTADNAYRDIQRWEGLVQYYQQIGDMTGVIEAEIGLGEARQAFSDMSGQLALAGLQLDNYGPLQIYLQQQYPGGTVEVRPYTDGSVEVFVDGNSIRRDYKNDLLEVLANSFNAEYRAGQTALAAQAAELRSQIFEKELETTGAIALERIQQQGRVDLKLLESELSRLEGAGDVSLKPVADPTGQNRQIFEYRAGGMRPRYITFREIPSASGEPLLQYDFVPLPGSE